MSSEVWQRPRDLRFPAQYYKFLARGRDGSEMVEFTVGDIPESRYDEACRFMVKHFVPYEPKLVARGGQHDPLVLEDYFDMYMSGIKQKVSIACHQKGCDEFIGVNILEVLGRDDPSPAFHVSRRLGSRGKKHSQLPFQPKSKTCCDVIGAVNYILDKSDIFNRHQADYYLSGTGLAVNADYTGRGD